MKLQQVPRKEFHETIAQLNLDDSPSNRIFRLADWPDRGLIQIGPVYLGLTEIGNICADVLILKGWLSDHERQQIDLELKKNNIYIRYGIRTSGGGYSTDSETSLFHFLIQDDQGRWWHPHHIGLNVTFDRDLDYNLFRAYLYHYGPWALPKGLTVNGDLSIDTLQPNLQIIEDITVNGKVHLTNYVREIKTSKIDVLRVKDTENQQLKIKDSQLRVMGITSCRNLKVAFNQSPVSTAILQTSNNIVLDSLDCKRLNASHSDAHLIGDVKIQDAIEIVRCQKIQGIPNKLELHGIFSVENSPEIKSLPHELVCGALTSIKSGVTELPKNGVCKGDLTITEGVKIPESFCYMGKLIEL